MLHSKHGKKKMKRLALLLAVTAVLSAAAPQSAFAGGSPAISSGWIQNGDLWQYRLSEDTIVRGGWIKDGDGWFYFDENGTMAADTTLLIGGHSYTFESSGAWRETVPADSLFVHFPAGRIENGVYEQPGAGIRISLPENAVVHAAEDLRYLSAQDYVPSYYDLLAIVPGQGMIGTVIQYNSDPMEKILADDQAVFSNFRGEYDLKPSSPQPAVIAGSPFEKISCEILGIIDLDVYLRSEDNKVLYLFIIVPKGDQAAADGLAGVVECIE